MNDIAILAEAVRTATDRLLEADPEDSTQVEEALRSRAEAVAQLAAAASANREAIPEEVLGKLRAAERAGEDLMVRVSMQREALRNQMHGLEREQQWLSALQEPVPSETHLTDLCG